MPINELFKRYLEQDRKVFTDSRNPVEGGIFFALKGGNFNGNLFAKQALKMGAAYAVVDESIEDDPRIIHVDNVLQSLQALATKNRRHCGTKVIAITGTNGKTTTKELCFQVFSQVYKTLATQGNLNNHIGVPLTLLRLTEEIDFAIVEMGANHPGDIMELCKIAEPDAGLITSIGKAHLEGFGSLEGVIKTKFELFDYLDQNGRLSFYQFGDSHIKDKFTQDINHVSFGDSMESNDAMIQTELMQELPEITLKFSGMTMHSVLFGRYNYNNLTSACALASWFEVPADSIRKGFEIYIPSNMRSQWVQYRSSKVLLDAYNANPSSMQLALEAFARMDAKPKWVIIGEMAELGNVAEAEHQALVHQVQDLGFDQAVFIGAFYKDAAVALDLEHFDNLEDAQSWLKTHWPNNAAVFIKGSRASHLEKLIR